MSIPTIDKFRVLLELVHGKKYYFMHEWKDELTDYFLISVLVA